MSLSVGTPNQDVLRSGTWRSLPPATSSHPTATFGLWPGTMIPSPRVATRRPSSAKPTARPSSLVDTRVVYCGDNLEQLEKLPDDCVDLIYIDPPFNSNRNYEVFWGERKEKRSFEDRHASTQAYVDNMRPGCV